MTADIIAFPTMAKPIDRDCKITIHNEMDGTAIVRIVPCPPGVPARRPFPTYEAAWPYADDLAKAYATIVINGNSSRSVHVAGPESECAG